MNNTQATMLKPVVIVRSIFIVIIVMFVVSVFQHPSLDTVALASVETVRDSCAEQSLGQVPVQGQTWKAQTFTPSSSYMLSFIDLPGTNLGGTTTLHIKQTSNGQPFGVDMAAASITSGNRFIFAAPFQLNQQQMYALVLSNQGGSYQWSYSGSASCYPLGDPFTSLDGGSSWSIDIVDFNFIIYDSKSTPQPTPTPTPRPTSTPLPQSNPVISPTVFVIVFPFGAPLYDPQQLTDELINKLEQGSKYHGYANPDAGPYLRYRLYSGAVLFANSIPPQLPDGKYDFASIYAQYDICNLLNSNAIAELWLWDAGQGGFPEWLTTGPDWTVTWGYNAPNCGKQLTTMVFNYNRTVASALHSFNHRLEGLAMRYFPCDFYTETWPWTGWPSSCSGLVSDRYGFVARPSAMNNQIGDCGDVHHPPNILDDHSYDYSNTTIINSICKDWRQDGMATVSSFNCQEWNCTEEGYHIWWMQNLPGYQNTNRDRAGVLMPNWLTYLFGTPSPRVFISTAAQDGWVLEASENSNKGGSLNATQAVFHLGDDAADKQFRAILSFNTAALPDNAVITKVQLKIKKQGSAGTDPFTILGGLKADIRTGKFGTSANLQASDFQAAPSESAVGTFGKTPANGWYSAKIGSAGWPAINLTGTTQFRLRFNKDDNDDLGASLMKFYSGNALAANRPQLIITYTVP